MDWGLDADTLRPWLLEINKGPDFNTKDARDEAIKGVTSLCVTATKCVTDIARDEAIKEAFMADVWNLVGLRGPHFLDHATRHNMRLVFDSANADDAAAGADAAAHRSTGRGSGNGKQQEKERKDL